MKKNYVKNLMTAGLLLGIIVINSCQKTEKSQTGENGKEITVDLKSAVIPTCSGSTTDHVISLDKAKAMIDKYQVAVKNRLVANLYDKGAWVKSLTIPAEYVRMLLAQPNCCSFRIYNGIGDDNMQHIILVGVDKLDRDILYTSFNSFANTNASPLPPGMILDELKPCPDICIGNYTTGP
jgi:hypothetical protein